MHPDEAGPTRSNAERRSADAPAPVDDPRVYLAAERTFLAWVRTSIALMGFGFLIARFAFWMRESAETQGISTTPRSHQRISPWLGFGMVVVGVIVSLMAAGRHRNYVRALQSGIKNPPLHVGTSLSIAAILALVGLAMAIHILAS